MDWGRLNRRYGPLISLLLGLATVLFLRRGIRFAPIAVAILLTGWALAALLGRMLERELDEDAPEPSPRQRWVQLGVRTLVAGMYQNVLFFLLPLWFASAAWPAANLAFPCLLGGMAVLSCFELAYTHWVLRRRIIRAVWSAVILFAVLVPASAVLVPGPQRWMVAGAAGLAGLAASLAAVPAWLRRPKRALGLGLGVAGLAVFAGFVLAPGLPPVPVQCVDSGVGVGVEAKELVGRSDAFVAGTPRLYAWFAVAAPEQFSQEVTFVWHREAEPIGRPFTTEVVGGRKQGFRTWSYLSKPWPGRWRVELLSDAGALIGRVRFSVHRADEAGAESGRGP